MRVALVALCLAACGAPARKPAEPPAPAAAPAPAPRLAAVDVYGTTPERAAAILAEVEPMLRETWPDTPPAALQRIRQHGDFVYVEISRITYFQEEGQVAYLTIDLVERADAARRMPFAPAPAAELADPEGLCATWRRYEQAFFAALQAGELGPEYKPCPAWHCLGDYQHPRLRADAEKLITRVPPNEAALARVLAESADPELRAAAAYALAHIDSGDRLVEYMLGAVDDPDAGVRNAAMRVLSDLAWRHPDVDVPIAPMLAAVDYPATTDRNKALAVIAGLLARPGAEALRQRVISVAGPTLLALLRLEQPNNHDFAWQILQQLSGESFDERDYAAWEAWLRSPR